MDRKSHRNCLGIVGGRRRHSSKRHASFPRVPEFTCQVAGCCQVFAAIEDYQHHYHMMHGNTCSFCNRAFPSGHLLDVHILEWHDSLFQILAQRQDMVGVDYTGHICSGEWDQGLGQA